MPGIMKWIQWYWQGLLVWEAWTDHCRLLVANPKTEEQYFRHDSFDLGLLWLKTLVALIFDGTKLWIAAPSKRNGCLLICGAFLPCIVVFSSLLATQACFPIVLPHSPYYFSCWASQGISISCSSNTPHDSYWLLAHNIFAAHSGFTNAPSFGANRRVHWYRRIVELRYGRTVLPTGPTAKKLILSHKARRKHTVKALCFLVSVGENYCFKTLACIVLWVIDFFIFCAMR